MIKKVLLLISFIFLIMKSQGQDDLTLPFEGDIVTYSETVETSLSKDQLYSNVKAWIASTFSEDKMTIDLEDKSSGKSIIKFEELPNFDYLGMKRESILQYFLQVDERENKYRYILKLVDHFHKQTAQSVPELVEIANGRKKTLTNTKGYAIKQIKLISDTSRNIIESLKEKITYVDDF